jgi:siroheme synthase-like protein
MKEKSSDIQELPGVVHEHKNRLYPIFLKLDQLETLLVGAGNVGLEKLQSLLSNSPEAKITVVALKIKGEIRRIISEHPLCRIIQGPFKEYDLDNKRIVICATDDKELHKRIKSLANKKGILVNVADTPELCDFYLGSIVQKGNIKIAVSTNGKSPTIAKRLKEVIADMIPVEMEDVLDNLQTIRNGLKLSFQQKVRRLNEITKELVKQNYEG